VNNQVMAVFCREARLELEAMYIVAMTQEWDVVQMINVFKGLYSGQC
jgi:hypothetical protein